MALLQAKGLFTYLFNFPIAEAQSNKEMAYSRVYGWLNHKQYVCNYTPCRYQELSLAQGAKEMPLFQEITYSTWMWFFSSNISL